MHSETISALIRAVDYAPRDGGALLILLDALAEHGYPDDAIRAAQLCVRAGLGWCISEGPARSKVNIEFREYHTRRDNDGTYPEYGRAIVCLWFYGGNRATIFWRRAHDYARWRACRTVSGNRELSAMFRDLDNRAEYYS